MEVISTLHLGIHIRELKQHFSQNIQIAFGNKDDETYPLNPIT